MPLTSCTSSCTRNITNTSEFQIFKYIDFLKDIYNNSTSCFNTIIATLIRTYSTHVAFGNKCYVNYNLHSIF